MCEKKSSEFRYYIPDNLEMCEKKGSEFRYYIPKDKKDAFIGPKA